MQTIMSEDGKGSFLVLISPRATAWHRSPAIARHVSIGMAIRALLLVTISTCTDTASLCPDQLSSSACRVIALLAMLAVVI
jgi:hypothetical protein